jgi:DNA-binding NarL/FixJ family response regulator
VKAPDYRCLIVDDSAAFRTAARGMLEAAGMTVVDTVSTLATAVEAAAATRPDLILVDIDLSGESGFDVVEALYDAKPEPRPAMILVSTHNEDDFADMVEASSAIGFIPKFELSAELITQTIARRGPRP